MISYRSNSSSTESATARNICCRREGTRVYQMGGFNGLSSSCYRYSSGHRRAAALIGINQYHMKSMHVHSLASNNPRLLRRKFLQLYSYTSTEYEYCFCNMQIC